MLIVCPWLSKESQGQTINICDSLSGGLLCWMELIASLMIYQIVWNVVDRVHVGDEKYKIHGNLLSADTTVPMTLMSEVKTDL